MSETPPEAIPAPAKRPLPSAKARKAAARQALTKQSRRWQGRVLRVRYRWLASGNNPATESGSFPGIAIPTGHGATVLTLAVAKKQARRAVDRNRVKRLVREWFRGAAKAVKPADLLVGLHRPWIRYASEPDLLADLGDLLGVLAGTSPAADRPRPASFERPGDRNPKMASPKPPRDPRSARPPAPATLTSPPVPPAA